jgi:hypothetical protein
VTAAAPCARRHWAPPPLASAAGALPPEVLELPELLIVACAARRIVLGRDPLCDLPLRAGGVSHQHAEIERSDTGFALRDLDSRNGTSLVGMPLAGRVPRGVADGEEIDVA